MPNEFTPPLHDGCANPPCAQCQTVSAALLDKLAKADNTAAHATKRWHEAEAFRPFNELTPAEAERLAVMLEEAGEIQQAIGKILRHGYESCNPNQKAGPTNRETLEREIGDFQAVMHRMIVAHDIEEERIEERMRKKLKSSQQYLHHQPALVTS